MAVLIISFLSLILLALFNLTRLVMLAIPGPSISNNRRYHRGPISIRQSWFCQSPAVLKQEQKKFESNATSDEHLSEEIVPTALDSPKKRLLAHFRSMTWWDSAPDSDSDYVPSDEEDEEDEKVEREGDEDDTSTEELSPLDEDEREESDEGELEVEPESDGRWWPSREDKRRWEKHYWQADAAFQRRYGCSIDTPHVPETRRRPRLKKMARYRTYTLVLVSLVLVYVIQLALVYSASSWAFSLVTWRQWTSSDDDDVNDDGNNDLNTRGHRPAKFQPIAHLSPLLVPDYVHTGLQLCATLSRRVVKSEHDRFATQHALRACDIAVKFAPEESHEAIEAHVLRGDLRSLLAQFDRAEDDYNAARTLILNVRSMSHDIVSLSQVSRYIDLKMIANRWTHYFMTKNFKKLRLAVKAHLAARSEENKGEDETNRAVQQLAAAWLSAFKRQKTILEVLTLQRSWTLRRLVYKADATSGR